MSAKEDKSQDKELDDLLDSEYFQKNCQNSCHLYDVMLSFYQEKFLSLRILVRIWLPLKYFVLRCPRGF